MEFGGSSGNEDGSSNTTNYETYNVIRRIHNHDYLPLANVTKTMRKVLPPYAKISDASKVAVQESVSQFIKIITSEANDHAHSQLRKTISADDLLLAMTNLGFSDYVHPLALYLKRLRQSENPHPSMEESMFDQSLDLTPEMVPNDSQNFVFSSPLMYASQLPSLEAGQMFREGGFISPPPLLPPLPPYYTESMSQVDIEYNWTSTNSPPNNVQYDNIQDPNVTSSPFPHYGYFSDPKSGGY